MTRNADPVNPPHYKQSPSGIEAIEVCEHLSFCIGNAMKYLWRAGQKGDLVEDLRKAIWYIEREIERSAKPFPPAKHPCRICKDPVHPDAKDNGLCLYHDNEWEAWRKAVSQPMGAVKRTKQRL